MEYEDNFLEELEQDHAAHESEAEERDSVDEQLNGDYSSEILEASMEELERVTASLFTSIAQI